MSESDVLRRMLDERGIEHDDEFVKSGMPYCDGYEATYWCDDSFGYVEPIRPKPSTIGSHPELTIHDCTPEQAIAATLGAGECEIVNRNGYWYCTGCNEMIGSDDPWSELFTNGNAIGLWNHCPNCGKVVKR